MSSIYGITVEAATEIIKANTIGNREGNDARIAEYVRLFNERYSEPQKITYVEYLNTY